MVKCVCVCGNFECKAILVNSCCCDWLIKSWRHCLWDVFCSPLRFRKLGRRRKPVEAGSLRSVSPWSCANSAPGKSMSLLMLLSKSSEKTRGFSCLSFSTKKSGLKITGWLWGISWLMTILHTVPLWQDKTEQKQTKQQTNWLFFFFPHANCLISSYSKRIQL